MKCRTLLACWGVALCSLVAALNSVQAQTTAFTYQGRLLVNAAPVTGSYDLQFILRQTDNSQSGPTLTNAPVGVTNGLFTTVLNFGNVFGGNLLYLEIGVRTNGSTAAYTILSPTQLLTSVPQAILALQSANYNGVIADNQLSTNIARLNASAIFGNLVTLNNATGKFGGILSGTFNGAATGTFNGTATGTFTGDGSAVTNVNITNVVGVVQSNPNWQLIQAASQQAVAANNYLTTNAAQTTLILPASPGVGSTVKISGSGAGGWIVAQNANQSILTDTLNLGAGQAWTNQLTSQNWQAVASSADGSRLAAGYATGNIYYSSNGGKTWTQSDATNQAWSGIASSADGMRMVAAPGNSGSYVYTSVNGGANWTRQTGGLTAAITIHSVASSADGINLVAANNSGLGYIYTSNNGGTNWTQRLNNQNWQAVASSADGTRLAAAPSGFAQLYISHDSGVTWTNQGPTNSWTCIASSADGTRLVAAISTGNIYTSGDGGYSWTPRATSQAWTCVASSANGMNLVAGYGSVGYLYTSSDYGQNWVQRNNGIPGAGQKWAALASSANGSRLLAANNGGFLYNSVATTTPGVGGSLVGTQFSVLELQFVGNGQWMPLGFIGSFTGN